MFVPVFLSTVHQTRVNWALFVRKFTPPEIWKRHAVLLRIHHGNIIQRLYRVRVKLRTVSWIQKVFDKSNSENGCTAARNPHPDRSDKKRTPKFVGEIQVMFDNDRSKSIKSITRDMGVSEFLIREVMQEDLWYFSSYNMINIQSFITSHKEQEERHHCKVLNKVNYLLEQTFLCFFIDEKDFNRNKMVNLQNNRWLTLSPQDIVKWMKTKYLVPIMVFGLVPGDGDVRSSFIFLHGLRLNTEANIKCL